MFFLRQFVVQEHSKSLYVTVDDVTAIILKNDVIFTITSQAIQIFFIGLFLILINKMSKLS